MIAFCFDGDAMKEAFSCLLRNSVFPHAEEVT